MFVSYNNRQQSTQIRTGVNGFMSVLSDITGGDNTPPPQTQAQQTNLVDTPEAREFFMNSLGFDSSMVYEGNIQEDYNHMIGIIKAPTPQQFTNTPYPYSMPMAPPPYGAQPTAYGGYPPVNPYPYLTQEQIMDATASAAVMLQTPAPSSYPCLPGEIDSDEPPF